MKRLGYLINKAVNLGEWCLIKISRHGPPLSFLFFSDDLLLFGEAFVQQIMVTKDYLVVFGLASGQKGEFFKNQNFIFQLMWMMLK